MKKNHNFTASDNENIRVTTYGELTSDTPRCVFYVHGFKSFKDWGFVPYIGEFLARDGLFAVTFNFSHNGVGDKPTEFTELDKFEHNTFSREIRELGELMGALKDGFFGDVSEPRIGLLGHSRGGAITLLTAASNKDVRAAVTWSSVSDLNRYNDAVKESWRRRGYIEIPNKRTGQIMRLGTNLLDDVETHGQTTLNIENAVKSLAKPLLVIHGEEDESVPFDEGKKISNWADPTFADFVPIPETGHTFGAGHPFGGSTPALDRVLGLSSEFFRKHL